MDSRGRRAPNPSLRPTFTRAELHSRGMSRHDIRRAVDERSLTRLRRGGYVVGGPAPGRHEHFVERSRTAMRHVAEGTVLSHVSAAAVLDLPLWGLPTDKVTATRHRPGHGHQRTSNTVTYSAPLAGAVTVVDGIPVTTPARTAVDLARAYQLDPAVCVADSALHLGVATRSDIACHVESAAGRRGAGRARLMLELTSALSESPLETRSRLEMSRGGLPAPEENPELFDDEGFFLARPDFYWREWKLLGECDGLGKYTRGGVAQASVTAAVGGGRSGRTGSSARATPW